MVTSAADVPAAAWATRRRTLWAVVALAVTLMALSVSDQHLAGFDPATKLDLRFGYGTADVAELFRAYGAAGRRAYAINLAIDTIYPLVLAAAAILLTARAFGPTRRWPWFAPIAFAVLDVVENALLAVALRQYPEVAASLVAVASPITQVKLVSFVLTLAVGLAAVAVLASRAIGSRTRGSGA
jgi:hypothetical protein